MTFTFLHHTYTPENIKELYEQDSSYFTLTEFVRKWRKGEHTFEFQTSGSTGQPKTIHIYRKQIEASVANTAQFLGLQTHEQILLCLSPNYIASIMMAARGLILDMDVHIVKSSSDPFADLGDQHIDFASFVPFQIYEMIENNQLDRLAKIRNVLIGGAPLTDDAFEVLAKLPNHIYQTYGMTETVTHVALMPIKDDPKAAKYEILPNIYIGRNDENCLWIDGDVTSNSKIQTTDVVDMIDDTHFVWLGRKDHIINSGGIKIHPEQIEKIIGEEMQKLGFHNAFYVTGIDDPKLGQKLILMVEDKIEKQTLLETINPIIESKLSKYHVPKAVKYLKVFERTGSGKVKRV